MKTFEENWTAWLDGQLAGKDLAEFEASLPDRAAAEEEKRGTDKLRSLLKQQLVARPMGNEDFFNHQLRTRLKTEAAGNNESRASVGLRPAWPISRLLWLGATSIAIFAVCTIFVMREKQPVDQSQYLSQILKARVDPAVSPNATVSIFQAREAKVTVLWVDGLQSLPPEYATK